MHVVSSSTGRYRVEGPVGVGPDGAVHRTTAERLGARPSALRTLDVPAGAARTRLRRDAEIVASLGHPGLALVTDVLEADEQSVQVVSTLGTGGSLEDRLVLGPLGADEAIEVACTVARALAAAHGVGLVHGRVSARNVVFTDAGPVVTDLVQAAALGRRADFGDDTVALLHLAASLVDGDDHSPRVSAYRSVCRWAIESDAGLAGFVRALQRLAATPGDVHAPPAPGSIAAVGPDAPAHLHSAVAGLVIAAALAAGAVIGAVGSLLPVL